MSRASGCNLSQCAYCCQQLAKMCDGTALQTALGQHSKADQVKYILKIDVANYFGFMNLHTVINVLNDSGYVGELSGRLEAVLTSHASLRSSRGILQGMFPSNLFGNFYMEPIDRFLKEYGVSAARYVDDIYVFLVVLKLPIDCSASHSIDDVFRAVW